VEKKKTQKNHNKAHRPITQRDKPTKKVQERSLRINKPPKKNPKVIQQDDSPQDGCPTPIIPKSHRHPHFTLKRQSKKKKTPQKRSETPHQP